MIEIDNLHKYYGAYRAVGPLTATIAEGEVVGLLGLNGAGKTTTLRILACDLLPSSGSVRVAGVDVTEHPEQVRQMIGYLPDQPPLYDEMSVTQYLEFAARLRKVAAPLVPASVERALNAAGLIEVRHQLIAALSHGYRQRVGIAQAIVHRPRLVVLDEPSGGLDPIQIKEMRSLVRSLGGEHTVLVSSHNLPEISEMCDRLLVIGDGQIVASGTEAELVARWSRDQHYEVVLRVPPSVSLENVVLQLQKFEGVSSVVEGKVRESGDQLHLLEVSSGRDVRAEIARVVVQSECELLGLQRSERELESVFSKLAQGRTAEEAA
jgi:ABC-2 type transport system ATP-binding protein